MHSNVVGYSIGNRAAYAAIGAVDCDNEDDVTAEVNPKGPNLWRFAGVIAKEVKAKMGICKDNAANRMVAWDLAGKSLKTHNVRLCDLPKFQTLAVAMVFIPSVWDVTAAQMMRAEPIRWRKREMDGPPGFWTWLVGGPNRPATPVQ